MKTESQKQEEFSKKKYFADSMGHKNIFTGIPIEWCNGKDLIYPYNFLCRIFTDVWMCHYEDTSYDNYNYSRKSGYKIYSWAYDIINEIANSEYCDAIISEYLNIELPYGDKKLHGRNRVILFTYYKNSLKGKDVDKICSITRETVRKIISRRLHHLTRMRNCEEEGARALYNEILQKVYRKLNSYSLMIVEQLEETRK